MKDGKEMTWKHKRKKEILEGYLVRIASLDYTPLLFSGVSALANMASILNTIC
jgi:hypothetical protein